MHDWKIIVITEPGDHTRMALILHVEDSPDMGVFLVAGPYRSSTTRHHKVAGLSVNDRERCSSQLMSARDILDLRDVFDSRSEIHVFREDEVRKFNQKVFGKFYRMPPEWWDDLQLCSPEDAAKAVAEERAMREAMREGQDEDEGDDDEKETLQ